MHAELFNDHHMRFLPILTLSAIGLCGSLNAQNEAQPATEPAKESKSKRTCRIVFPERPNGAPKSAYLFDGKENQPVSLPSMNFSPVVGFPAGDLTILMTPSKITDIENLPQGLPMLRIPESVKDFYILVTPDPSNSAFPLRMNLVNTSDGKFNPGETLWFNLTDHRIVAKLGESRLSVNPKGRTISQSPVSKSAYYRAEFGYQTGGEGDFHKITEQQWWHDTNSRHLGFIVNTGGRLPKIYFYRDFRLSNE